MPPGRYPARNLHSGRGRSKTELYDQSRSGMLGRNFLSSSSVNNTPRLGCLRAVARYSRNAIKHVSGHAVALQAVAYVRVNCFRAASALNRKIYAADAESATGAPPGAALPPRAGGNGPYNQTKWIIFGAVWHSLRSPWLPCWLLAPLGLC